MLTMQRCQHDDTFSDRCDHRQSWIYVFECVLVL